MKVSIITVVFNAVQTIEECLRSIYDQTYSPIEHIIIDGGSTDGTLSVIEKHRNKISHMVSEPDKGIYDAMNKGLNLASGDIVGILNADDFYINNRICLNDCC